MNNMCLVLQFGCPLHLQINNGLLILYHFVDYVHLYVARYDVYCDTGSTLALNMCVSLHKVVNN